MRPYRNGDGQRGRGITLPELLVVVAVIALAVTVAVPLISRAVRSARARAAANQFVVGLMAARMLAVTQQASVDVIVAASPADYYEYPDRTGAPRRFDMPVGVRIVSSTNPISFLANGTVPAGANTVIEGRVDDSHVEIWEVEVSILGVSTVTHRRVP